MTRFPLALALLAALCTSACGGSGGGGGNDDPGENGTTAPSLHWVVSHPVNDEGGFLAAVAALPDGSTISVGTFSLAIRFAVGEPNETTLTTTGVWAGYIARHDASGGFVWARKVDGTLGTFLKDIVVREDGSFVIAGWFEGTVTLAPGEFEETTYTTAAPTWSDGFFALYAADGTLFWSRRLGSSDGDTQVLRLTRTTDEFLGIGGLGDGTTLVFGAGEPGETTLTQATLEGFVAKYELDTGLLVWVRQTESTGFAACWGVAPLPGGGIACSGRYVGTTAIDVGVDVTSVGGTRDVYVAAYGSDGTPLWIRTLGGVGTETPERLAASGTGQVVVTGAYGIGITAGSEGAFPESLASPGVGEVFFFASYASDGTFGWLRGVEGATSESIGFDVSFFPSGAIGLGGTFRGQIVLGQGDPLETTLRATGGADRNGFAARYTPGGTLEWALRVADTVESGVTAVATLFDDTCVLGGYFSGTGTWGGGLPGETSLTADTLEPFLARYFDDGGP